MRAGYAAAAVKVARGGEAACCSSQGDAAGHQQQVSCPHRSFLTLAAALTLNGFAMYAVVIALVPLLTERGEPPRRRLGARPGRRGPDPRPRPLRNSFFLPGFSPAFTDAPQTWSGASRASPAA